MWLLSASRAELHYFHSPEDEQLQRDGGYAILSHVWNKTTDLPEQTFQDLQELQRQCAALCSDPRDLACEKIRRCCELAERHGFKWVWIDTCCIDKSSSAELSEAINSMYQYYALARLCYAYLKDVEMPPTYPGLAGRRRLPPQFHRSRWHTRGWTLQELIAPQVVLFLSQSWSILGSKADLAQELENITRVPAKVLTLEISPAVMSIAQRMSWVAGRETTRIEDEAYCLMGIFDINMPTLYGEGRRAFRRLQEEIMKRTSDTTIFAW
ncbi:heterokaryon incompatibility protein-domain-containing protein, partial [Fomes fomentarius]